MAENSLCKRSSVVPNTISVVERPRLSINSSTTSPYHPLPAEAELHFRDLWSQRWDRRWRRRNGRSWVRNGGGRRALRGYFIRSQSTCYWGSIFWDERTGRILKQGIIRQGAIYANIALRTSSAEGVAFGHSASPPHSPARPEDSMPSMAMSVSKEAA